MYNVSNLNVSASVGQQSQGHWISAKQRAAVNFDSDTVWPPLVKKQQHKKEESSSGKPVPFCLIVSNQWTWAVPRWDMQSSCFDICLTVKNHTLQTAVSAALHGGFLTAQWRCHTGTCWELQPHSGEHRRKTRYLLNTKPLFAIHYNGVELLYVMIMRAGRKAPTLKVSANWYTRAQLIGAFYEPMHIELPRYKKSGWDPAACLRMVYLKAVFLKYLWMQLKFVLARACRVSFKREILKTFK